MTYWELMDATIEAELRGEAYSLEDAVSELATEALDEIRRECEAEGYDGEILDAVEGEIGWRHAMALQASQKPAHGEGA